MSSDSNYKRTANINWFTISSEFSAWHVFGHKLVNVIRDKSEQRAGGVESESSSQIAIVAYKSLCLTWMLMKLNIQHFNGSELDPPISAQPFGASCLCY